MKRCPQCNRTFWDDTYTFCLEDGSLLSAPFDHQQTLVLPSTPYPNSQDAPTILDIQTKKRRITKTEELYFDFWNNFNEFSRATGTFLNLHKSYPQYWYPFSVGRGNTIIISLTASLQKRRLGCEIYLTGINAKKYFKLLEKDKEAVEEKAGKLDWQELPEKQDCRIILYRYNVDISDKKNWNDAYAWLKSEAELFYNTFVPLIGVLPR